jgi:hypothetical protein
MLTKITSKLNRNIIGFGCNAHTCIIHNFAKRAFDSMPVDIRVLVTKSFGYLQIFVRVDCEMTMQKYFTTSKEFYNSALSYLEVYNKDNENFSNLICLLLNKVPSWESFDNVIEQMSSGCEVLTVNHNQVSYECTYLCGYQLHRGSEWFSCNPPPSLPPTKKWPEVCSHLKENIVLHGNMKKFVELFLCLAGSSASIERRFSCINYILSEEKT